MGNLDFRQFRRAPSHRKPTMPGASDLAAMLQAGETLDDLAATFERNPHTIIKTLNEGGYSSSGETATSNSPSFRLSADDIAALKVMLADGVPRAEIADAFGISAGAVTYHAIRSGFGRGGDQANDQPPTLGRFFAYPPWFDSALCAETDLDLFFPEIGGSSKEAKSVCARCTVAAECLDYALDNNERFGIWGGLSERERRSIAATLNTQQEPA